MTFHCFHPLSFQPLSYTVVGYFLLFSSFATAQPTSQPVPTAVRHTPTANVPPSRPVSSRTQPTPPPSRRENKTAATPIPRSNPPQTTKPSATTVTTGTKPTPLAERTDRYDMYFRHKQVGEFTRMEKQMNNGLVRVENESRMNIRMLFTTVKATNHSQCFYDQTGQLVEFTITSKVRGKTTIYTGKRDQRGLTITETQGKNKKQGFFPIDSFQGTSLDYRFPSARHGITIRRQYLIIPRMQVVEQSLSYRETTPRKVFGREQALYEITIRNQRGHGTVLVTQDGRMVASRMLGKLGVVEIRWNGSK